MKEQTYTCQRPACGHKWVSRPPDDARPGWKPVRCPRCQSVKWDVPRKESVVVDRGLAHILDEIK